MTQFWLIAAGMILLALGFIITPLFKKRQQETVDRNTLNLNVIKQQIEELEADLKNGKLEQSVYDAAKIDLEKALLQDVEDDNKPVVSNDRSARWLSLILLVTLPAGAFLLYKQLGTPAAIEGISNNVASPHSETPEAPVMTMEEAIAQLSARLEQEPNNAEGWGMLARTYMSLQQFDKAVDAYEKLHNLVGDNPEVLVRYADALAMLQNRKISGKPYALIKTALEKDPGNAQANWMAGLAEEELGNYTAALKHWRTVRPLLSTQPQLLQTLDSLIARAESQISGVSVSDAPQTTDQPIVESSSSEKITVSVELSPELSAMAQPADTVFIFAQAMQGPPMPLAVSRQQVKDLPITVTLDDSMAMMPQMRLSAYDQVKVGARISKSGQATPTSGDLSGSVDSIKPGQEEPVEILIDQKIP